MPINNDKTAHYKLCVAKKREKIPRKCEMSKLQSAPFIIHIITNQRERTPHNNEIDVGFERHCPLLVKPTAINLLIQQQWQTVTQDHQQIEDDEMQLINITEFRLSKYKH